MNSLPSILVLLFITFSPLITAFILPQRGPNVPVTLPPSHSADVTFGDDGITPRSAVTFGVRDDGVTLDGSVTLNPRHAADSVTVGDDGVTIRQESVTFGTKDCATPGGCFTRQADDVTVGNDGVTLLHQNRPNIPVTLPPKHHHPNVPVTLPPSQSADVTFGTKDCITPGGCFTRHADDVTMDNDGVTPRSAVTFGMRDDGVTLGGSVTLNPRHAADSVTSGDDGVTFRHGEESVTFGTNDCVTPGGCFTRQADDVTVGNDGMTSLHQDRPNIPVTLPPKHHHPNVPVTLPPSDSVVTIGDNGVTPRSAVTFGMHDGVTLDEAVTFDAQKSGTVGMNDCATPGSCFTRHADSVTVENDGVTLPQHNIIKRFVTEKFVDPFTAPPAME